MLPLWYSQIEKDVTWERINSPCTNKHQDVIALWGNGRAYSLSYPFLLLPSRLTECLTNMVLIHKSEFLTQCSGYLFMCPLLNEKKCFSSFLIIVIIINYCSVNTGLHCRSSMTTTLQCFSEANGRVKVKY